MNKELLFYYNQELSYLRQQGAEFAEKYPKIAARLRLGPHEVSDPHVERLIEAIAFLNARIRHKLEDQFPEITNALLSIIYPHYLLPIPSLAVIQFRPKPELTQNYSVPANTLIESESVEEVNCRFNTCYDTTIWPIKITDLKMTGLPLSAPLIERKEIVSCLSLKLQTSAPDLNFLDLAPSSLRFYLHGELMLMLQLYELVFKNCCAVIISNKSKTQLKQLNPSVCLKTVGFKDEEGLLPYPAQSFLGYRLLSEFFAFPEKFLFFDLIGLNAINLENMGNEIEIHFYFTHSFISLEKNLTYNMIALNCTPVINLFNQSAEPIQLDHTQVEYPVIADVRQPHALEVYNIQRVIGTKNKNETEEYLPLYSTKYSHENLTAKKYWFLHRNPSITPTKNEHFETKLSIIDANIDSHINNDTILSIETLCTNHNLPQHLPFGGGRPVFQYVKNTAPATIVCLTAPTESLYPSTHFDAHWHLVSHLSLNYLSIANSSSKDNPLREILRLYDIQKSSHNERLINSISSIEHRRVNGRSSDGKSIIQGLEIKIEFDKSEFSNGSLWLFITVLGHFLQLYASINSFIELVVTYKGSTEVNYRWQSQNGTAPII